MAAGENCYKKEARQASLDACSLRLGRHDDSIAHKFKPKQAYCFDPQKSAWHRYGVDHDEG